MKGTRVSINTLRIQGTPDAGTTIANLGATLAEHLSEAFQSPNVKLAQRSLFSLPPSSPSLLPEGQGGHSPSPSGGGERGEGNGPAPASYRIDSIRLKLPQGASTAVIGHAVARAVANAVRAGRRPG